MSYKGQTELSVSKQISSSSDIMQHIYVASLSIMTNCAQTATKINDRENIAAAETERMT